MPVTPRHLSQSAKTHIASVAVPAGSPAGTDIASLILFRAPTNIRIQRISLIGSAAAVGIDAANTSVWEIETRLGGVQVPLSSETFDNVNVFPAAFTPLEIADPGPVGIAVAENQLLCLNVTNGALAETPAALIQIEYWTDEDL